jgi:hypothetical protein
MRNLPRASDKTLQTTPIVEKLAGRYLLRKKIGEGGMGAVFVAHDVELEREVAVKMLTPTLVNDPDVVERFEREARLTAKLDHPNIVPIYDVGRDAGRPFIVMKLLVGDTLAGVLRQKGGFTSDETLKLMKQLAAGLDYIHAKGFIHRDIKAGNIFLSPEGHATILDFGILRSRKANASLTRTGMVMGTPHYMAPEQALGLKDVDHRVDLYALAVVLFECLTGTLPFEADSELRLIQMQAHSPPPEIVDRAPWIPKPVADVVKHALAKNPEDRFASGEELVKALESSYRDSGGHPAAPPQPPMAVLVQPPASAVSAPRLEPAVASASLPIVEGQPLEEVPRRRRWLQTAVLLSTGLLVVAVMLWAPWKQAERETSVLQGRSVDAGLPSVGAAEDLNTDPAISADAGAFLADADLDAGAEDDDPKSVAESAPDGGRPGFVQSAKRKGKLNVITMHGGEPYWAQVSVDGIPKGRTPLLLDLPSGRYVVRVERPGFRAEERRVLVAAGKPALIRIDLTP